MAFTIDATKESIIERNNPSNRASVSSAPGTPLAKRTRNNTATGPKSPVAKRVKKTTQLLVEHKNELDQATLSHFSPPAPTIRHLELLRSSNQARETPGRFQD
ncbi:MAG: hypothetical protein M1829_002803 [Trizodia sp. TS-e1964]|nr:MAG: hypothetical protein M1829_002803 [Trizodia sp. TS-e1964]